MQNNPITSELAQMIRKQKDKDTLKFKALKVTECFPYCSTSALYAYIFIAGIIEGKRSERAKRAKRKGGATI